MRKHHLLFFRFSSILVLVLYAQITKCEDTDVKIPIKVGVVLDMETSTAKISNSCMYMAISDFYDTHADYKTRLRLHTKDSHSDVTGAAFAAIDLLRKVQVEVIIGPQTSEQSEFLADLGEKTKTPIVSFSATNPSIYSRSPYFVRATPNDRTQVEAIVSLAQAFEWTKVILVHEDSDYGNRLVPHLVNAFQDKNIRISRRSVMSPFASSDEIFEELQKLVEMQTSIFIVHMSASFGSKFFLKVKEKGMMTEGYAWIVTNGLMNVLPSLEPSVIDSMQGVLGLDSYIPRTERLENFSTVWKKKFIEDNPGIKNAEMITFGLQAYDSIWALAIAAEKVRDIFTNFRQDHNGNTADFFHMQISQTGTKLLEQLLRTEFEGLSGEFRLTDGQLEPTAFKLLNVIGRGGREIGFWTTNHGISKDIKFQGDTTVSTPLDIVWPGESSSIPKGWVIPISGKKLRIGVPIQDGFNELVYARKDPLTNATVIEGYCIDVFNSVIALLPRAIPYEYVPFHVGGKGARSYNDLVHQVYIQNFDAVVGDVTITANRSLFVDFAIPYTDGGVWMIVPLMQKPRQPFSTLFVILNLLYFTITGLLIWTLQQQKSMDASYNESVRKFVNLILEKITPQFRMNLIIWIRIVFAGGIFYYLYTLATMFILDPPEPSITDFRKLIENGDVVGYAQGAFTADLLKQAHFDESHLKPYGSTEECHELLSKGSQNGGVSAVFDDMPYVDIFIAKYCTKYMKIGPTHYADGYGFVFPRGSPIVSDISKAVLKVTETNKFADNSPEWFRANVTCGNYPRIRFTLTAMFGLIPLLPVIASFRFYIRSRTFKDKKKSS